MAIRKNKIRGHRRRWKQIARWQADYISVDLIDYLQHEGDYFYAKIRVHPWSGLSFADSDPKEPTGKTKQKMVSGLIAIYEDWKRQLDTLGQPYYLKIWLYEPRFSNSQVVCAVGESLAKYTHTFSLVKEKATLPLVYGEVNETLKNFVWEQGLDEDHYDDYMVGDPELYPSFVDYENAKRWFNRLLKKPHTTTTSKGYDNEELTVYSFRRGNVWIGAKV
jgi:hypothetical protein